MKHIFLNLSYILKNLCLGVAVGWLVHFDILPGIFRIIAPVLLIIVLSVDLILNSCGLFKKYVAQVPRLIRAISLSVMLFALFVARVIFAEMRGELIIYYLFAALLCGFCYYISISRCKKNNNEEDIC